MTDTVQYAQRLRQAETAQLRAQCTALSRFHGCMKEEDLKKAQGARLKAARLGAGYNTAKAAAEMLRVSENSYMQHENGTRGYSARATYYAQAFGTSPEWLLWGRPASRLKEIEAELARITDAERRALAEDLVLTTIRRIGEAS